MRHRTRGGSQQTAPRSLSLGTEAEKILRGIISLPEQESSLMVSRTDLGILNERSLLVVIIRAPERQRDTSEDRDGRDSEFCLCGHL